MGKIANSHLWPSRYLRCADLRFCLISGRQTVDYRAHVDAHNIWRIGYDLFEETRNLLTSG